MRIEKKTEDSVKGVHYTVPFFSAYFIYYAAYCVFSSYTVLFLTERSYSATVCGIITSLTFLANLLMEPVGGYITDTFLPTRRYLLACIGAVSLLSVFCTKFMDQPWLMLPGMVLAAGITYPFSQLMDAWVNISKEKQPDLVYSRIRAGGSIGFAVMSVLGGYYFKYRGWNDYFLVQMVLFLLMIPFLFLLPDTSLGNRRKKGDKEEKNLSFGQAFRVLAKNRQFVFCLAVSTLYWLSHRPVGSFLSLIIADRGGDAGIYGSVCGAGAAVEFASLMLLASFWKKE
ncbi:MAG: MFS transporter, partial [Clostridium sp.]|nr:MFS transporter [Clostridium sp.]